MQTPTDIPRAQKFLRDFFKKARIGEKLILCQGQSALPKHEAFELCHRSGDILVNVDGYMYLNGVALLHEQPVLDHIEEKWEDHIVKFHNYFTSNQSDKTKKNYWCDIPLGVITQMQQTIFFNGQILYDKPWLYWWAHPEGVIVLTDGGSKFTLIKTSGEEQVIYEGLWHKVIGIDKQGILIIKIPESSLFYCADYADYCADHDEFFRILPGIKMFFNEIEIPVQTNDKILCLGHPLSGIVIFRNREYLLNGGQTVVGRGFDWLTALDMYEPFFHNNWMCRIYYGEHTKFLIDEKVLFECECKEGEIPFIQHHEMGILINYRGVLYINGQQIYDGPHKDYFATPKGVMIKDGDKFIHAFFVGDDMFGAIVKTPVYEGNHDKSRILDGNLVIYDESKKEVFVVKG